MNQLNRVTNDLIPILLIIIGYSIIWYFENWKVALGIFMIISGNNRFIILELTKLALYIKKINKRNY